MNLVFRITLSFLLISMLVFFTGGLITYHVIKREVDAEQRYFLLEREDNMVQHIRRRMPDRVITRPKMVVTPVMATTESQIFSDTLVVHSDLERLETHLKLTSIRNIKGKWYRIELFDLIVESDDIVDGVIESLFKMYLILLGSVLILAFVSSFYLLRPFRRTLQEIQQFSIQSPKDVKFEKSSVSEFGQLNTFLQSMLEKMKTDYRVLKEFNENASHELKTPIAIVRSKLDRLIQSERLRAEELTLIQESQNALNHLKRLGDALALISKLDNQEFVEQSEINISEVVQRKTNEISDISSVRNIRFKKEIQENVAIKMNDTLLDIMLNNLIGNALKHNVEGGYVHIKLSPNELIIGNSGIKLPFPDNEVFNRFKKTGGDSLGLGLAIVKKICSYYGFEATYRNKDEHHEVSVSFIPNKSIDII